MNFTRAQPGARRRYTSEGSLQNVTMLAEVRSHVLSKVKGSPNDAGVAWPLIACYVNGARKVYGTERD